jgi:hypothetical protein
MPTLSFHLNTRDVLTVTVEDEIYIRAMNADA